MIPTERKRCDEDCLDTDHSALVAVAALGARRLRRRRRRAATAPRSPADDFAAATEAPEDAQQGGTLEVIAAGDFDYLDPGAAYYKYTYMFTSADAPRPDRLAARRRQTSPARPRRRGARDLGRPPDGHLHAPRRRHVQPAGRPRGDLGGRQVRDRAHVAAGGRRTDTRELHGRLDGFDDALEAGQGGRHGRPRHQRHRDPRRQDDRLQAHRGDGDGRWSRRCRSRSSAPVPEEYAKEFDAESPSTYGEHQVATGPYMIENNAEGELIGYKPRQGGPPGPQPELGSRDRLPPGVPRRDHVPGGLHRRQLGLHADPRGRVAGQRRHPPHAGSAQAGGAGVPRPAGSWRRRAATDTWRSTRRSRRSTTSTSARRCSRPPTARRCAWRAAASWSAPIATHFIPPGRARVRGGRRPRGRRARLHREPAAATPSSRRSTCSEAGYESGKYEGGEEILMVAENAGVDKEVGEVVLDQFEELGFEVEFRQVARTSCTRSSARCPRPRSPCARTSAGSRTSTTRRRCSTRRSTATNIEPTANSNWPQLDVPEINEAMNEAGADRRHRRAGAGLGRARHPGHGAGAGDPVRLGRPGQRPVGRTSPA